MSFRPAFPVCIACILFAGSTAWAEPPERLDFSQFPGEIVEEIVVPIPAEIFAVLDKLGEPEWHRGIALPEEKRPFRERGFLALTFGCVVAEGFVAVQAKSAEEIEEIGRRALELAESLGLANAVRPHSLSIIEAAEAGDWELVRSELDGTQQTVRETMESLRDEDLSALVSLGGWLRGTHVVTEFIVESYSEDKAELLYQPALIAHFRETLAGLTGPERDAPKIRFLATGLARIEAIIVDAPRITQESVEEVRKISREMLEEIYFIPLEPAVEEVSGSF